MAKDNKELPAQSAYRQRLSEMLDLTYELEGLLHIGVSRSMVPPRLNHLIVNKLNAIVALADEPPAPSGKEMKESVDAPACEKAEDESIEEEAAPSAVESRDGFYEEEIEEEPIQKVVPRSVAEPLAAPLPEEAKKNDAPRLAPAGGRLFSINDRFLYARELFNGRVADFDKAINVAITLDSPEEAEEYFTSEYNFNLENPMAVEFLEKIKTIY